MLNFLRLMGKHPEGVTAKDTFTLVEEDKPFLVRNGKTPSKTTVYHYRNTLLHLGLLQRKKGKLYVTESNAVTNLLLNPSYGASLSQEEKRTFSELVFAQQDCRNFFSDIFWPFDKSYSLDSWLSRAVPVTWREMDSIGNRRVRMQALHHINAIDLITENHIQALLYGVRYWYRDELGLIDELFREDYGNIMFPVMPSATTSEDEILSRLFSGFQFEQEWERISLRDLAFSLCIEMRISVERLYNLIRSLQHTYPGHIVFVSTSRSFATITAGSGHREEFELRSYLKDDRGIYISHIRIHRRLKELLK
jgi:hypothetical protein